MAIGRVANGVGSKLIQIVKNETAGLGLAVFVCMVSYQSNLF